MALGGRFQQRTGGRFSWLELDVLGRLTLAIMDDG